MSLSELRVFGRSGTPTSPLTLGTMNFGEGPGGASGSARTGSAGTGTAGAAAATGADEGIRIIQSAVDAGITAVDTADVYSQGESEQVVGRALRGRRDDVFLATKFHGQMSANPAHSGNSRRWIMQAVEGSLRRLQTDRIDLYQAHRPDYNTDVLEDPLLRHLGVHPGAAGGGAVAGHHESPGPARGQPGPLFHAGPRQ